MIISFILLGINNSLYGLIFIFIIYLLRGIITPILRNKINLYTPSNKRATVLSIRSFVIRVSFAFCAPILGNIADNQGLSLSFYLLAIAIGSFSLLSVYKLKQIN